MMKRLKMMLTAAVVALAVQAKAADAVWTNKTASGTVSWNTAANWLDGYIGGTADDDDVNLAYSFTPTAVFNGQGVNLFGNSRSFHSVTGIPSQVITRSGESSGSITVVDPSPFRGVWAQGGFVSTYIANPGNGNTAEFWRVANGHNPFFDVAAGGKARIRDLLGKGSINLQGAGELVLSTPRARTRVVGLGSSPTGILKESLLDLPRTRARSGTRPWTDFAAWRIKTFGGDFDPVRIAGRGSLSVRCKGGRVCAEWLAVARPCSVCGRAWGGGVG